MTADRSALLRVEDLHVSFRNRRRTVHAVNGLSYTVARGRTLAIVGESGSGKTVSSRAVLGLLPESAKVTGSIRLDGAELVGLGDRQLARYRGARVAMVFQDPTRSLNPTMRIGAQIREAILLHPEIGKDIGKDVGRDIGTRIGKRAAHERAVGLLEKVRIPFPARCYYQYPHELSGGMRQRVMIAIALACDPQLLIADEATTALDVTTQAQIMRLLRDLQAELGTAIILISHDLGLAASYADDIVVMYAGRAAEQASTRELFTNVRMPYTRALFDAIPRVTGQAHTRFPVVHGRPPDLSRIPAGCAFAPRCRQALDRCHDEVPEFTEHVPGHRWACWNPCEPAGTRG